MSKKRSPEVYLNAAKMLENREEIFCCFAINLSDGNDYGKEDYLFKRLYYQKTSRKDRQGGWFSHIKKGRKRQEARIRALKRTAKISKMLSSGKIKWTDLPKMRK